MTDIYTFQLSNEAQVTNVTTKYTLNNEEHLVGDKKPVKSTLTVKITSREVELSQSPQGTTY